MAMAMARARATERATERAMKRATERATARAAARVGTCQQCREHQTDLEGNLFLCQGTELCGGSCHHLKEG